MSDYSSTTWLDNLPGVQTGTKLNATNMNKMETGIDNAHIEIEAITPAALIYQYKNLGGF